jgi:sialate O-acetylesterase
VKKYFIRAASISTFLFLVFVANAQEDKNFLIRLEGSWKFSIGDSIKWLNPDFDDNRWESIKVPSAWEDQGFYGYDGYAWYRTSFMATKEMKYKDMYLLLGYINDVDQVYINGRLIGFSGTFPPDYSPGTEARRKYPVPLEYLNLQAKNVIAVRVYNHQMAGGIISGDIGICSFYNMKPDISLLGMWLFKTGDNKTWKNMEYKEKQWKKIVVPGSWNNQGFKDYNGIAWYRRHFVVNEDFSNQKMVLVIGNIDNCDEVYINEKLIGKNGKVANGKTCYPEEANKKIRAYSIPDNILMQNKENLITVKVFDPKQRGGIIEGPVGIVKLTNFNKYSNSPLESIDK